MTPIDVPQPAHSVAPACAARPEAIDRLPGGLARQGSPNVATESTAHSKSTRRSFLTGSRSP